MSKTLKENVKVIVVDDQFNWRELIRKALGDICNLTMFEAYEGALNALERESFDLAILDIRLVDEDDFNVQGIALLRKLREGSPLSRVVLLSGYVDQIRPKIFDTYKPDAVFEKGLSFSRDAFKDKIKELIENMEK